MTLNFYIVLLQQVFWLKYVVRKSCSLAKLKELSSEKVTKKWVNFYKLSLIFDEPILTGLSKADCICVLFVQNFLKNAFRFLKGALKHGSDFKKNGSNPGYSSEPVATADSSLTERDWRSLPLDLVLGKTRNCIWAVGFAPPHPIYSRDN